VYSRNLSRDLSDDLRSEALVALTEAVTAVSKGPLASSLKQFILTRVHGRLRDHLHDSKLVRVPARSARRKIKAGKTVSITDADAVTGDPTLEIDLIEEIQSCIEDDVDRQILIARLRGLNNAETAVLLGLTTVKVCRALKAIRNRLKVKLEKA